MYQGYLLILEITFFILVYRNIVITYNFKDLAGVPQVTKEYVKDIEQQIESADLSAVSFIKSSNISLAMTPTKPN